MMERVSIQRSISIRPGSRSMERVKRIVYLRGIAIPRVYFRSNNKLWFSFEIVVDSMWIPNGASRGPIFTIIMSA